MLNRFEGTPFACLMKHAIGDNLHPVSPCACVSFAPWYGVVNGFDVPAPLAPKFVRNLKTLKNKQLPDLKDPRLFTVLRIFEKSRQKRILPVFHLLVV